MTKEEMDALYEAVNKELEDNRIYADVGVWEADGAVHVDVTIDWGDWKHEHLRAGFIVADLLNNCGREIIRSEEEVTETDGSDTYSAIHRFVIV